MSATGGQKNGKTEILMSYIGCLFLCVFLPLAGIRNPVDWRLLLKEHIAEIAKLSKLKYFWFLG